MSYQNCILTITGPSGAGKTTLIRNLLQQMGDKAKPLIRVTTRGPRLDDNAEEYHYVSLKEFKELERANVLLYPIMLNGWWHAMRKDQVDQAVFGLTRVLLADVSIEGVINLRHYVGSSIPIKSVFLAHCSEELLRVRMSKRGESNIEQRILDGSTWQAKAKESPIPFKFIDAQQSSAEVARIVLRFVHSS